MTREEALEMLNLLAAEFDIKVPHLRWSFRVKRGRANPMHNIVMLGPLAWRGSVPSLLHEFAHILVHRRFPLRACRAHGPEFMEALLDITLAWYGDTSKYPWSTEYKTVAAFGRARRIV